ncbi:17_t:CDS:2 [Funneliformis mosseae]|uniref:Squalene synthase n=1 Tax=Funneliformis mosseae TaxID=27381 RepID=A0A9N9BGQ4_FUNMO|nr:17_t:CDS:2 [Funneliformis mosseae]
MASVFLQSIFHPSEIVALVQYKFFRPSPVNFIPPEQKAKIRCYEFLSQTSRSFDAVIRELDDDIRDAVCIFYLVLRGLDTIEDDMSIPIMKKEPLLRNFHEIIYKKGWTFNESGPDEKDRQLLVEFSIIIEEFLNLEKKFQNVIVEITNKMGNGMADYAKNASHQEYGILTNEDYDLYCHYVAGLVGNGLSCIFSASGLEKSELAKITEISNSMGLFLQKTNIIRDYSEDLSDNRRFWPKEIWSEYVDDLADLKKPGYEIKAINCLSTMVLNALQHIPDCLTYLNKLQNESIFRFCAIPQVMAIATLTLLFKNHNVYNSIVKIRKGETIKLILKCTNIYEIANVFRYYTRVIIKKNDPKDPNFMKISMACGKVEQWCQTNIPDIDSYHLSTPKGLDKNDNRLIFVVFIILAFTAYFLGYELNN